MAFIWHKRQICSQLFLFKGSYWFYTHNTLRMDKKAWKKFAILWLHHWLWAQRWWCRPHRCNKTGGKEKRGISERKKWPFCCQCRETNLFLRVYGWNKIWLFWSGRESMDGISSKEQTLKLKKTRRRRKKKQRLKLTEIQLIRTGKKFKRKIFCFLSSNWIFLSFEKDAIIWHKKEVKTWILC